jgi:hypothetical protein
VVWNATTWDGGAGSGLARIGKAELGLEWLSPVEWYVVIRIGRAGQAMDWHGAVSVGLVGCGIIRKGKVWLGLRRHGSAWLSPVVRSAMERQALGGAGGAWLGEAVACGLECFASGGLGARWPGAGRLGMAAACGVVWFGTLGDGPPRSGLAWVGQACAGLERPAGRRNGCRLRCGTE